MKLQKFIFTFLILLITFQFCIAQEKPKADLVEEFGVVNWSNFRHLFDRFLTEIINTPYSKGYIVIYGDKDEPINKYYREIQLKKHISFRNFDENRLVFLYGDEKEGIKTQFWKVSNNADIPGFDEGDWNYKLPQTVKPTIIHQTLDFSEVGDPNLSIEFYIEFYSKFLKANPDSRAHLVIYEDSTKGFYQTRKQMLRELVSKNKIQRNRLKFFYVKSKKSNIEFWFVPKIAK